MTKFFKKLGRKNIKLFIQIKKLQYLGHLVYTQRRKIRTIKKYKDELKEKGVSVK